MIPTWSPTCHVRVSFQCLYVNIVQVLKRLNHLQTLLQHRHHLEPQNHPSRLCVYNCPLPVPHSLSLPSELAADSRWSLHPPRRLSQSVLLQDISYSTARMRQPNRSRRQPVVSDLFWISTRPSHQRLHLTVECRLKGLSAHLASEKPDADFALHLDCHGLFMVAKEAFELGGQTLLFLRTGRLRATGFAFTLEDC
jgi:hypothetical protein